VGCRFGLLWGVTAVCEGVVLNFCLFWRDTMLCGSVSCMFGLLCVGTAVCGVLSCNFGLFWKDTEVCGGVV
jgi:hypothetical protein